MRRLAILAVLASLLAGSAGLHWWRTRNVGPVQRGARLAAELGCLSCHGPAGRLADPEGTRGIGNVPSFEHDDVAAYAKTDGEIREWILDGRPRRVREERADEPEPLLRMPAWRGRVSEDEAGQLAAWIRALSDFDPVPEPVAAGRRTAARLGCFACHGPQGRGDTPNPGSLKGYVPAWDGADFAELARDEAEVREWIRDGAPRRLREHPLASRFLSRQAIRMPAFGAYLTDAEVEQLVAYIGWLRRPLPPPAR